MQPAGQLQGQVGRERLSAACAWARIQSQGHHHHIHHYLIHHHRHHHHNHHHRPHPHCHCWVLLHEHLINKDAIIKIWIIFKIVIIRTDDRFLQSHRSVQQPTSLSLFLLRSIPTKMMTTAMVKTIKALARPRDVGAFRHVLCVLCTHVQIKMAYLHCEQTQHFISSCWIASIMLQRFEVTVA